VCIVLLKRIVSQAADFTQRWRDAIALEAIGRLHFETHDRTLREKVSQIVRPLEDARLFLVTDFLVFSPDSWQYIDAPLRQRLEAFVAGLPTELLSDLEKLVRVEPLGAAARRRMAAMSVEEIDATLFFDTPLEAIDTLIGHLRPSRFYGSPRSRRIDCPNAPKPKRL
jgi:hypothetical protein